MNVLKLNVVLIIGLMSLSSCENKVDSLTTSGGFPYEIITEGEGRNAAPTDFVSFEINILGDEGTVLYQSGIDDNRNMLQIPPEEAEIGANDFVMESLIGRRVGDSIVLKIPADTIRKTTELDPAINEVLYCIRVRTVKEESVFMAEMEAEQLKLAELAEKLTAEEPIVAERIAGILADYKAGKFEGEIKSDESGLQYIVHEMGSGEMTADGEIASVHYYGILENGTMFDNSWRAGRPYEFPVGRGKAIEGWDIAMSILPAGSKATLIIPYTLAYGESGRPPMIPEKATLIFYIEIDEL